MEIEEYKFDHFKNIDEVMYYFNYWYKEEDIYSINKYLSLKDFNYISNKYQELQKENKRLYNLNNTIFRELLDKKYENKKQKEVIDKIMNLIKQYGKYDGKKCTCGFQMWSADFNKILDMLKEVSE